ncbi:hypothetical protein MEN98_26345, partial [Dolichospermum sp. ST_sed8]|nr:hypothetical protein [Dolichospermum sp. ST_sed8]
MTKKRLTLIDIKCEYTTPKHSVLPIGTGLILIFEFIFSLSVVSGQLFIRELHKKMNCLQQRFAIQCYLACPCIIRGPDARTTRNFGIFFKLEVSY